MTLGGLLWGCLKHSSSTRHSRIGRITSAHEDVELPRRRQRLRVLVRGAIVHHTDTGRCTSQHDNRPFRTLILAGCCFWIVQAMPHNVRHGNPMGLYDALPCSARAFHRTNKNRISMCANIRYSTCRKMLYYVFSIIFCEMTTFFC